MAHTEFGFQVVQKFLAEIAPYGHQDFQPKLIGRGINVMISPLPRNKRARHPNQAESGEAATAPQAGPESNGSPPANERPVRPQPQSQPQVSEPKSKAGGNFANTPFAQLEINR